MIDPSRDPLSPPIGAVGPIVVLLVDDQAFVGAALRMLLRSEADIELHCCLSAVEAVAAANRLSPSVVLQDLVMPDGDGLSLVAAFGANPLTSATPVVVLSGNDDAATRARALAAGATDYLVKLPPKAELIACIRRHASPGAAVADTLDLSVIGVFLDAGAPDFTLRLIDQFLQEAAARVATLKDAARRGDNTALNAIAHSLKGSSMIMGVSRLGTLCAQIEEQVAPPAVGTVGPLLMAEIEQELVRVQHALGIQRAAVVHG
jgi:PleD family two-component response regulator